MTQQYIAFIESGEQTPLLENVCKVVNIVTTSVVSLCTTHCEVN
ncbi:MAG: hypothetical protein WCS30_00960 [Selenomonadaceae bacterium]